MMNGFAMKKTEFERQSDTRNQERTVGQPASPCLPGVVLVRCLALLLGELGHQQTCRALLGGCFAPKGLFQTLG